jgi:hypothetical protein
LAFGQAVLATVVGKHHWDQWTIACLDTLGIEGHAVACLAIVRKHRLQLTSDRSLVLPPYTLPHCM